MSRPSIFDTEAMKTPQVAADPAVVALEPAQEGPEMMRTSLYIPRAVHDKLREIAFVERVKVNDLLVQGIDQVLTKRGFPSTAELRDSITA